MARRVSKRLAKIAPSATMAVNTRARQMIAKGRDVISFAAGEPDFPTPEHIVAAAARAAHDPANHKYTAAAGLPPLREAVAEYTARYSGVSVAAEEVIITNGGKQAVFEAFAALLDPGDEVLLPVPYWVTYPAALELAGGVTVPVPSGIDSGFKVTVDDLDRVKTDRSRALVLVSPSNPSGAVYDETEITAIGNWANENGIWIVADEIYQRLVYDVDIAPSVAGLLPGFENWILVNGVAKSFAMTGWRVGWMVGPKDIVGAATRFQSHATSNVANITQQAALAAITGPQDVVEEMRLQFDKRRRLMHGMFTSIERVRCLEPAGAFYVFPEVTELLGGDYPSSAALAEGILEETGAALVPGESFGAPGFLRLSYALGEAEIEAGVSRIAEMFGRL